MSPKRRGTSNGSEDPPPVSNALNHNKNSHDMNDLQKADIILSQKRTRRKRKVIADTEKAVPQKSRRKSPRLMLDDLEDLKNAIVKREGIGYAETVMSRESAVQHAQSSMVSRASEAMQASRALEAWQALEAKRVTDITKATAKASTIPEPSSLSEENDEYTTTGSLVHYPRPLRIALREVHAHLRVSTTPKDSTTPKGSPTPRVSTAPKVATTPEVSTTPKGSTTPIDVTTPKDPTKVYIAMYDEMVYGVVEYELLGTYSNVEDANEKVLSSFKKGEYTSLFMDNVGGKYGENHEDDHSNEIFFHAKSAPTGDTVGWWIDEHGCLSLNAEDAGPDGDYYNMYVSRQVIE